MPERLAKASERERRTFLGLASNNRIEVQFVLLAVLEQSELRHAPQGPCRDIQSDETTDFGYPNSLALKVGQLTLLGLVMGVRNHVRHQRAFSCKIASACHFFSPFGIVFFPAGRRVVIKGRGECQQSIRGNDGTKGNLKCPRDSIVRLLPLKSNRLHFGCF